MSATDSPLNRIVLLGGGTAGWMTAAAMARLLPDTYQITLVESDAIGTVGVGEATLPHLRFFNQRLGIDEAEFMRETDATFKLGIQFANWGAKDEAYIHPFGDYGFKHKGIGFHHYFLKARQLGNQHDIGQYSLPVTACEQGKFQYPDDDPASVFSTFSYAYHIDAGKYAAFLRDFSETRGVTRVEGKVTDVIHRLSDGYIERLVLGNGQKIDGDFFIDCSGFRAQLIGQVLDCEFEDWSKWLPCNSAFAVGCESPVDPTPYTRAIARDAGWQWRIPLQHRVGNGHVFCDQFTDRQSALDTLLENLDGAPLQEPVSLKFKAGKRPVMWRKNCVAIGLSSGFLEPLESTSIYLIQSAIMKLLELFPTEESLRQKAYAFNQSMNMEMEKIRDFLILHYHATSREDTPFWEYCRNMDVPHSLQEKMALFRQTGVIDTYQLGLFLEPSWLAVYLGQGIYPERGDPRVDALPANYVTSMLEKIQSAISQSTASIPTHKSVLQAIERNGTSVNSATPSMSLYGNRHD